jgi:dTDP-4-amino-4,6-dideoxygalactose transaminase
VTTKATVKRKIEDLAIFGARPAFNEPLHVGRPNLGDRETFLGRMAEIWDRNWLTNDGPMVRLLEQKVAEFVGVKHCVALCNATIALEIAIRALGLTGEVIVPSFTFVATAHALQWQEITPVFCDIEPQNHTIDPKRVEQLITPRTSGIIGVHLWGRPCDVEALEDIAQRRNLKLLFDAAHAFGCSYKGKRIGGFGRCEIFSFHATKFFNSFEGGAILTNDDDLAEKTRLMRNFGFRGYDNVIYIGTNGKMTEPCAAMGLTSLESVGDFVRRNRNNHAAYARELDGLSGIRLMEYDSPEDRNYQYVVLEVDEAACGLARDGLVAALTAENVRARRYFHPGCHRMEPYKSLFPNAGLLLPETEKVCQKIVVLPTGTSVNESAISNITSTIRIAALNSTDVTRRLRSSPVAVSARAGAAQRPHTSEARPSAEE